MKKTTQLTLGLTLLLAFSSFAQDPALPPTDPTASASDVISLFSNTYTNVSVDTWRTEWSIGDLEEIQINGNDTKKYTNLNFVGIETVGPNMIDASEMATFHVDVYTPNMTSVRIKLVDFGADGAFGGDDDTEHEITFVPEMAEWNSFDIPLSDFVGLTSRSNIAQIIFAGTPAGEGTLYIDNVYFSAIEVQSDVPSIAAPTPTRDAENVISLFSNAYSNVEVDSWRTDWSVATLEDVQIAGNDTKLYTSLSFVGVETVGPNMIDAGTMEYFHVDVWTPNMNLFRVKLVDFGADGEFAGGDDTEHELVFTPTPNTWNSYDILLSDFVNLTSRSNIAQIIFSGTPAGAGIAYIDNVYFTNQSLSLADISRKAISIFPNPSSNYITIKSESAIDTVEIVNMLGQSVKSISVGQSEFNIDVSDFETGIYLMNIKSNGVITKKRFAKN
ncbi:MAG: T9SS type A sorting domain-containing protein [Flavobacterium sp.]|nr:T9SS type A sorting domain-containing protein [Flavobacterium sp.]